MNTNRTELSMNELELVTGGDFNPFAVAKEAADIIPNAAEKAVEFVKNIWDSIFG